VEIKQSVKNALFMTSAACLFLFVVPGVSACICNPLPLTPKAELEISDAVFIGRVLDITAVKRRSSTGDGYVDAFAVRLKVLHLFKGPKTNEIIVRSGNSCDVRFGKGERWLIFAVLSENSLVAGPCSRTQLAKNAQQDLECLKGRACGKVCGMYRRARHQPRECDCSEADEET